VRPQTASVTPNLTDDDKAILAELLRETVERDCFPLSPRVKLLRPGSCEADPRSPVETLAAPMPPGER
jgi:hypothetical protein